jgi:hypothetical protein
VEALRTEADTVQAWPRWFVKLALRLAQLERGKAYELILIMPEGGGDPQWFVKVGSKLDGGK